MMISKRAMHMRITLCVICCLMLCAITVVQAQGTKPPLTITVTSPVAGQKLSSGMSYTVTWTGGYPDETVDINLGDSVKKVALPDGRLKNLVNDGQESFFIPNSVKPGKYHFYVGKPGAGVHWGYSGVFDIVGPAMDVDVAVQLLGGPKWNLGSQQKALFTVSAQTGASFSEIPVGGVIIVRAALSKGLRVGDGNAMPLSPLGTKKEQWRCKWDAWDSSKETQVYCELLVTGTAFKTGSFEIPVMPGINNFDREKNTYWTEDARALATLQAPLVDAKQTSSKSNKVDIVGIVMGIKIPASSGGKWPVGSEQTLTLQPILGDILLMKEWISNSSPMQIYVDIPSQVSLVSASGVHWTCGKAQSDGKPDDAKPRLLCTYISSGPDTLSGVGQISWPKLIESVAVKMKVVNAGDFNLTSHCAVTPKFKLPTLPGKLYEPYTCNYDTTKITN